MGKNVSKTTKRTCSMALAAILAFAPVTVFGATDTTNHWANAVISDWKSKGLIKGYDDGTFKPDNSVSRAEFVTMMNNVLKNNAQGTVSFTDVKETDWFYQAVASAVNAGYCSGYEDGTFKPSETISRAEAAVMIANAVGLEQDAAGAEGFSDEIPVWAAEGVGAVVKAGYMSGYSDGTFGAVQSITRAESVSSLNRAATEKGTAAAMEGVVLTEKEAVLEDQVVEGNVLIDSAVEKATLRDMEIHDDLVIRCAEDDKVVLNNVTVQGRIIIEEAGVEVSFSGKTNVKEVQVGAVCELTAVDFEGSIDKVQVVDELTEKGNVVIEVPVDEVVVDKGAALRVSADVRSIIFAEDAKGSTLYITEDAEVKTVTAEAGIEIAGKGSIAKLEAKADNITVDGDTNIQKTEVTSGVEAPATSDQNTGSSGGGGSSSVTRYTVTFDSDGGSAVDSQTVSKGRTASEPAEPTKNGYIFAGWFDGDTKFDFTTPIRSSLTLKAKWIINSEGNTFVTVYVGEKGYASLADALGDTELAEGATIVLLKDQTASALFKITKDVTIDGNGNGITADENMTNSHLIEAFGASVTLKNVTLDCAGFAKGLNIYNNNVSKGEDKTVALENVMIQNSAGSGITLNGSIMNAKGLNISGSAWQSIDVSKGGGVNTPSALTLDDARGLRDTIGIAQEGDSDAKVQVGGTDWKAVKTVFGTKTKYVFREGATGNELECYVGTAEQLTAALAERADKIYVMADISKDMGTANAKAFEIIDDVTIIGQKDDQSKVTITTDAAAFYITDDVKVTMENIRLVGKGADGAETGTAWMGIGTYNQNKDVELTMENCQIAGFNFGMYFGLNSSDSTMSVTKMDLKEVTFENCVTKAIYTENLTDSTFDECSFSNNGDNSKEIGLPDYAKSFLSAVDINLKYGEYTGIAFTDCTFTGNGAEKGGALLIKARDDGNYADKPARLTDVTITGCTFVDNNNDIMLGEPDKNNVGPANVTIDDVLVEGSKDYSGISVQDNRKRDTATTILLNEVESVDADTVTEAVSDETGAATE